MDNTNIFNVACSIHRILGISEYVAGGLVLSPKGWAKMDKDMFRQGRKSDALIDYPIHMTGYEKIDLFNWQEQAKDMLSQIAFTQIVNVQSETVDRYILEGKMHPDMEVPVSEHRSFRFFTKATVEKYAKEFGWTLITKENIKEIFMQKVKTMTMSYSYKPVFMLAFLDNMNEVGEARLEDVAHDFARYYEGRVAGGLPAEKKTCIFTKGGYTERDVERLILSMPFNRFENMRVMHHSKYISTLAFYKSLAKQLNNADLEEIRTACHNALSRYFGDLV